jgi:DNA-binding transcriptional ArsR family regulator
MVELTLDPFGLDMIFRSLADPTRRDILKRVATKEMSISDIAKPYKMSLAAISKHLKILEQAKLVIKRRQGKEQIVQLSPVAFKEAADYLKEYERMWNDRFDALENYLKTMPNEKGPHKR